MSPREFTAPSGLGFQAFFEEDEMKYTGPAKPIPTSREPIDDKVEAVIFILLAIVAVLILYFGE